VNTVLVGRWSAVSGTGRRHRRRCSRGGGGSFLSLTPATINAGGRDLQIAGYVRDFFSAIQLRHDFGAVYLCRLCDDRSKPNTQCDGERYARDRWYDFPHHSGSSIHCYEIQTTAEHSRNRNAVKCTKSRHEALKNSTNSVTPVTADSAISRACQALGCKVNRAVRGPADRSGAWELA
jgi:hypothetical protein